MSDYARSINKHYGQSEFSAKILTALQEAGKNIDALTREDLSSFDEYHGGGLEATRELAQLAELREGLQVLDIGSGIGGPARTLAEEFGCRVTGLDLTEEFCRTAVVLTDLLHLSDLVTFRQGDALDMPFDDETFDVVWTQGVLMNIEDKKRLFERIHRVLRPGGRLALQTELSGNREELHYPNYWAEDASFSFFIPPDECRRLLLESGFKELVWRDISDEMSKSSSQRRTKRAKAPIGFSVMAKSEDQERIWAENGRRNLQEGRMVVIRALFERPI
jgi:ubiquinone/menaquinone biosynthesis C-methylase UbiE